MKRLLHPFSHDKSDEARYKRACHYLPGGVNSPVRAFQAVGGVPLFIRKAKGAYLYAENGSSYIDYINAWGPMLLGHAHPSVVEAGRLALERSACYGAPTEDEVALAALVCEFMPSIEQVRMVNSGTEATFSALRLARAFTSREAVLKFSGCYHGHADVFLVEAGSGVATLGLPNSPGVPQGATANTLSCTYNDLDEVEALMHQRGDQVAAIIVEPVGGNMGCVPPKEGFLEGLRTCCDHYGALLIFDEVMTGFRVALGGAQARYGVQPDLTALGKVLGGGMPVAAYGGRKEIMQQVAPAGAVYQAGTLAGHPVGMACGLATLEELKKNPAHYEHLENNTRALTQGLTELAVAHNIPHCIQSVGSMWTLFFTEHSAITHASQAQACDTKRYARFFHSMLARGIYLPPSQLESAFSSVAIGEKEREKTLKAAQEAFAELVS